MLSNGYSTDLITQQVLASATRRDDVVSNIDPTRYLEIFRKSGRCDIAQLERAIVDLRDYLLTPEEQDNSVKNKVTVEYFFSVVGSIIDFTYTKSLKTGRGREVHLPKTTPKINEINKVFLACRDRVDLKQGFVTILLNKCPCLYKVEHDFLRKNYFIGCLTGLYTENITKDLIKFILEMYALVPDFKAEWLPVVERNYVAAQLPAFLFDSDWCKVQMPSVKYALWFFAQGEISGEEIISVIANANCSELHEQFNKDIWRDGYETKSFCMIETRSYVEMFKAIYDKSLTGLLWEKSKNTIRRFLKYHRCLSCEEFESVANIKANDASLEKLVLSHVGNYLRIKDWSLSFVLENFTGKRFSRISGFNKDIIILNTIESDRITSSHQWLRDNISAALFYIYYNPNNTNQKYNENFNLLFLKKENSESLKYQRIANIMKSKDHDDLREKAKKLLRSAKGYQNVIDRPHGENYLDILCFVDQVLAKLGSHSLAINTVKRRTSSTIEYCQPNARIDKDSVVQKIVYPKLEALLGDVEMLINTYLELDSPDANQVKYLYCLLELYELFYYESNSKLLTDRNLRENIMATQDATFTQASNFTLLGKSTASRAGLGIATTNLVPCVCI